MTAGGPGGVSYLGMKEGAMRLMDSNLSKTLHEAVPKLVKFAQFAVAEEHLGDHKGNEFEIVMAGNDPAVNIGVRTMQQSLDRLNTTNVEFASHSFTTREFGMAIKFNISDLQMAEFNLEGYTREVLSRDVAKVRDTFVAQEMTTTPYRYIPFNEIDGVCAGVDSYYCDQPRDSEGNAWVNMNDQDDWGEFFAVANPTPYAVAALGKIIPTQHFGWGSELIQPANETEKQLISDSKKRAFVADPLFIGHVMDITALEDPPNACVPGPFVTPDGVRQNCWLGGIDRSKPTAEIIAADYRIPKLNLAHVRNMVAYAVRLDILPYEKMRVGSTLHEGFVLIAPSVQIMNLIDSLNTTNQTSLLLGQGGFTPASAKDMNEIPQIAGASFKVPGLGVHVLAVVDDYATQNTFACYNQTFPIDDEEKCVENDPAYYWTTQYRHPIGAILNTKNVPIYEAAEAATIAFEETSRLLRNMGATEMCKRINDLMVPMEMRITDYLDGYGPCYLFGRKPVTELVNQAWTLRTQDPDDFKRLSGYGWVMRTGYKNNWTPKNSHTTFGMPFDISRLAIQWGDDGSSNYDPKWTTFQEDVLPYYARNKVIKFDFPTWLKAEENKSNIYEEGNTTGIQLKTKRGV